MVSCESCCFAQRATRGNFQFLRSGWGSKKSGEGDIFSFLSSKWIIFYWGNDIGDQMILYSSIVNVRSWTFSVCPGKQRWGVGEVEQREISYFTCKKLIFSLIHQGRYEDEAFILRERLELSSYGSSCTQERSQL